MPDTPILNTIESPEHLRKLPMEELPKLGAELRALLTEVVSTTGGHLASNLGVVDLTIALHRVFDFSKDFGFETHERKYNCSIKKRQGNQLIY